MVILQTKNITPLKGFFFYDYKLIFFKKKYLEVTQGCYYNYYILNIILNYLARTLHALVRERLLIIQRFFEQ